MKRWFAIHVRPDRAEALAAALRGAMAGWPCGEGILGVGVPEASIADVLGAEPGSSHVLVEIAVDEEGEIPIDLRLALPGLPEMAELALDDDLAPLSREQLDACIERDAELFARRHLPE